MIILKDKEIQTRPKTGSYRYGFLAGFLAVFFVFQSCSKNDQEADEMQSKEIKTGEPVADVKVSPVVRGKFILKTVSNGKVLGELETKLFFGIPGIIDKIFITNGSFVKEGQLLASLLNEEQKLAVRQAELQVAETRIVIDDQLISQGGRRGDSTSVSRDMYANIKLRSGYDRAVFDLQKAHLELRKTYIYAPMNGVIANLTLSPTNIIAVDAAFSTLINRDKLLISCPVLESEIMSIRPGQSASINPLGFPEKTYAGKVTNINPIVNEQGLVNLTVQVLHADARLLSGMNVRVMIENNVANQTIVPKDAVVDRNGRKVVFTYENGLAKWHYVTMGMQNDQFVTLNGQELLEKEVIVSGNINLAHDSKVRIEKSL